jgi:hypothetical protein
MILHRKRENHDIEGLSSVEQNEQGSQATISHGNPTVTFFNHHTAVFLAAKNGRRQQDRQDQSL